MIIPIPSPFAAHSPELCSLHAEYRSSTAMAIEIWDADEKLRKLDDTTLYNDRLPESPEQWSEFRTTVFVPELRGASCALFISVAPSEQDQTVDVSASLAKIEVRGLEIRRIATRSEPYHRLDMGQAAEKTVFVFADESVPDTVRGYRLASQLHLSEGLGCKGGETEKILYSDLMMLCWNAGPQTFRPILAPSIWYSAAGEMYLRDSFFALNGVHNRELNETFLISGLKIREGWGDQHSSRTKSRQCRAQIQ